MRKRPLIIVVMALLAASCGGSDNSQATEQAESLPTSTGVSPTSEVATTTTIAPAAALAQTTTTRPLATIAPTTSIAVTTTLSAPMYSASVNDITPDVASRMGSSWREGCPVGLEDLRHITLTHWNYDGEAVDGELVVAASVAADMVTVFGALFTSGFQIQRMELVDVFGGDDNLSMAANNTSAFNCREVAWRPGVWSRHALGLAIDVNPLVNPYVSSTRLLPPEGAEFTDRTVDAPGLIRADDEVVRAFAAVGWSWGGYWQSAKDYQHFASDR